MKRLLAILLVLFCFGFVAQPGPKALAGDLSSEVLLAQFPSPPPPPFTPPQPPPGPPAPPAVAQVPVPPVVRLTAAEATNVLRPLGLSLRVVGQENTNNPALANRIATQTPNPGARVNRGTAVQVRVYRLAAAPTPPGVPGVPILQLPRPQVPQPPALPRLTIRSLQELRLTRLPANMQKVNRLFVPMRGVPSINLMKAGRSLGSRLLLPEEFFQHRPIEVDRLMLQAVSARIQSILAGAIPPAVVDRRNAMPPIRDQGSRGTCVAFASMGALEAQLRAQGVNVELSEQYAYWLYKNQAPTSCGEGTNTFNSGNTLFRFPVPGEADWRYVSARTAQPGWPCLQVETQGVPSAAARRNARYRLARYIPIEASGLAGTSVNNVNYLQYVLAGGHDVVIGVHVAGDTWDAEDPKIDVRLDAQGRPAASRGGHAMVLVGYDRNQQHFIVRNSWGTDWGRNGYQYMTFDYVRTYGKYGYAVVRAGVLAADRIRLTEGRMELVHLKTRGNRSAQVQLRRQANRVALLGGTVWNTDGSVAGRIVPSTVASGGNYSADRRAAVGPGEADFQVVAERGVLYLVPRNGALAML